MKLILMLFTLLFCLTGCGQEETPAPVLPPEPMRRYRRPCLRSRRRSRRRSSGRP